MKKNGRISAWDAMRDAASGRTREIAEDLVVSKSVVGKWQEPHGGPKDSGSRSPVETTRDFMLSAMRRGTPRERALQPLYWLCDEMGLMAIARVEGSATRRELVEEFLRLQKEAADVTQDFCASIADGQITAEEARSFAKDFYEMVRAGYTLLNHIQESVSEDEE